MGREANSTRHKVAEQAENRAENVKNPEKKEENYKNN